MSATTDSPTAAPRASLVQRMKARWFDEADHPYCHLEREIEARLRPEATILEVGCGRTAPMLARYEHRAARRIGLDLVEFAPEAMASGAEVHRRDLCDTGLEDAVVDLAWSRAVMEHVEDADGAFRELARVLKPGGEYVFLTPNVGDYTTWISRAIPNRLHPLIVRLTEGRAEEDTFPAFYRCNSRRQVRKLCARHGLELTDFRYLGQYPNYFQFNALLFALASGYEKLISRYDALGFLRGWLLAVVRRPRA